MGEYIKRQDAIDAVLHKSYPREIESALKKIFLQLMSYKNMPEM